MKSIQRIGDSLKSVSENKTKIGRFGIGFNAVYHWTDLPSFISTKYLVLLDPQATIIPNVNPSNPGKIVNFVDNHEIKVKFEDQFAPYDGFEGFFVKSNQEFNGTLFRLPIRTKDQAELSMLSKRSITTNEILSLFNVLESEAASMLLFLKSLQEIEILIWNENDERPSLFSKFGLSNMSVDLMRQRQLMKSYNQLTSTGNNIHNIFTSDYSLCIHCQKSNGDIYSESWELCNQLGGKSASAMAADTNNSLLRLIPWGGIAALVHTTIIDTTSSETVTIPNMSHSGSAYCFLPLPIKTGLPVMVNGYFELSSNRRDIWSDSGDMTGDGAKRAQWNALLMRDIISPSYIRLLGRLKETLGWCSHYQSYWPVLSNIAEPWSIISNEFYRQCREEILLCTASTAEWITCKNALLIPASGPCLSADEFADNSTRLIDFLSIFRQSIVNCSVSLNESLVSSSTTNNIATPTYIRLVLRNLNISAHKQYDYAFIFNYCLSDLDLNRRFNQINELDSLRIIPLIDGSILGNFRIFNESQYCQIQELCGMGFSVSSSMLALASNNFNLNQACEDLLLNSESKGTGIYIFFEDDHELELFCAASQLIIDTTKISMQAKEFLSNEVLHRFSNIRKFESGLLVDLLRLILPKSSESSEVSLANGSIMQKSDFSVDDYNRLMSFLESFWKYISKNEALVKVVTCGPSIIVTQDDFFVPLTKLARILIPSFADARVSAHLIKVLTVLGSKILHSTLLDGNTSLPMVIKEYVYFPNRSSILLLLEGLCKDSRCLEDWYNLFGKMESAQIDELRSFIFTSDPVCNLSGIYVL